MTSSNVRLQHSMMLNHRVCSYHSRGIGEIHLGGRSTVRFCNIAARFLLVPNQHFQTSRCAAANDVVTRGSLTLAAEEDNASVDALAQQPRQFSGRQ